MKNTFDGDVTTGKKNRVVAILELEGADYRQCVAILDIAKQLFETLKDSNPLIVHTDANVGERRGDKFVDLKTAKFRTS